MGEEAHYKLDRSRARTSSLIKRGVVTVKVTEELPDEPKGPAYKLRYLYDLTVAFMGQRVGEDDIKVPQRYFTPEFLAELKEKGELEAEEFKIKYLGTEDVTTIDGTQYRGCDVVLLYDIKQNEVSQMAGFVHAVLDPVAAQMAAQGEQPSPGDKMASEDVKVRAAIKQGAIPVIGAARVDISAVTQGMPVSAGFDYMAPPGASSESEQP